MTGLLQYLAFGALALVPVLLHLRTVRRREATARAAAARNGVQTDGPRAQHPHIDVSHCIGCGSCIDACPEGDVLGLIAGKAAIVHGAKCIGHGLCADACPVGAIEIVMASPSISADLPRLTGEMETTIADLFIVGELGGLALIKNAVNQGRDCIDTIARRLAARRAQRTPDRYDVCIVGAGPGGLSASLRAIEKGLRYLTLEQGELGGTVAQYPRQKLVLTSPVEFPLHGRFGKLELSKEKLVKFWNDVAKRAGLTVHTGEKVESVTHDQTGFTIQTARGSYRAATVVLALGRRGSPRKLGVAGEDLSKVMYSLIDAEAYRNASILVVGGGDSAVEAALGLAAQPGNRVTVSYRQEEFSRIKERNRQRIEAAMKQGKVKVLFSSRVVEIRQDSVALEINGSVRELPNHWVWIFAGGESPNAFLTKIGVALGPHDLTEEAQQAVWPRHSAPVRPDPDRAGPPAARFSR